MKNFTRRLTAALIALGFLVSAAQAQTYNGVAVTPQFQPVQLLTNTATSGTQLYWPGGQGVLDVLGTWNGATVTLKYLASDGTTMKAAGTSCTFTADGNCVFYLPRGIIQAVISSAGGATSLTASAAVVPNYAG